MEERLTRLSVVKKSADQVAADMGDEAIVLNLKSGVYYGTQQIGVRIWSLLDEPHTVEAIRDAIVQEFEVDSERCERDVLAFLGQMELAGLLEIHDGIEREQNP